MIPPKGIFLVYPEGKLYDTSFWCCFFFFFGLLILYMLPILQSKKGLTKLHATKKLDYLHVVYFVKWAQYDLLMPKTTGATNHFNMHM